MCKAHVLRFSCGHGVLMGFELCSLGPCPLLKLTGQRLPQQPYRCYNCQHKMEKRQVMPQPTQDSRPSSIESYESGKSNSSADSIIPRVRRATTIPASSYPPSVQISDPLPGVARQPSGSVRMSLARCSTSNYDSSPSKIFSFSCKSSDHYPTPHYSGLPHFLPHQDHPCPPCQLECLRQQSDTDVMRAAKTEFGSLTCEMLIRNGTIKEWQAKPTLENYVDERRTEEREMWLHVSRKWTQDLKKARVLVAEEDGLGLLG